jgi:anti-sigma factor ChrR (cupin superfamily)
MDDGTRVSRRRQHESEMMVMIDNPPSSFPVPALVDGSATRAARWRADGDAPVGERDSMDDGTRVSRRRQHEGEMMVMIDNPPSSFPVPALVDGSATWAARWRADGDAPVGERDSMDDGTRVSRRRQHEGEMMR